MSFVLAIAAVMSVSAAAEVRSIRLQSFENRPALEVVTSEPVSVAIEIREGSLVLLRIPARAPEALSVPAVEPPLERLRLTREGLTTILSLQLAVGAVFETRHQPTVTTVLFGAAAGGKGATTVSADLYAQLFPSGPPAVQQPPPETPVDDRLRGTITMGRFAITPALTAAWADADVSFDTPQPTRSRYLQVQPGVTVATPLFAGQLDLNYEPRLRFFSSNPALEHTSHLAAARLGLPIGTRLASKVGYSYTRALLETNVVDAGREYFYNLSPFTYHDLDAQLALALAPRVSLLAKGTLARARFEETANTGFFDYDRRRIGAGVGYDLQPDLKADLTYSYDSMPPPPQRTFAETTGHALVATLAGAVGPLMSGSVHAGLRSQTSPQATGASGSWRGLVMGGALRRELGRSSSVEFSLNRAAQLSGFETNAYYVTNSVAGALTLPLPFQIAARGSVQWLRNDYPEIARELGLPRRDKLFGWTAGLGRDLGSRVWLRLDYRREKRRSNLPGLDVTTDGFMMQAGLRFSPGTGPQ